MTHSSPMPAKTLSRFEKEQLLLRKRTLKSRQYLEDVHRLGGAPHVIMSGARDGVRWTRLVARVGTATKGFRTALIGA